jgi:hypothetical protein
MQDERAGAPRNPFAKVLPVKRQAPTTPGKGRMGKKLKTSSSKAADVFDKKPVELVADGTAESQLLADNKAVRYSSRMTAH